VTPHGPFWSSPISWNAVRLDKTIVRRLSMNSPVSSEWIVEATRSYIAEHRNSHPEIAIAVQTIKALPLLADWNGGVAIRPDGELIGFLWDEPQSAKVETDAHLRFLALVEGSQRYAELASLSQKRTSDDRDCPLCGGTGRLRELEERGMDTKNIRCYCGGTGWLPLDVSDPPRLVKKRLTEREVLAYYKQPQTFHHRRGAPEWTSNRKSRDILSFDSRG
jgi:hypothetical protein